MQNIIKIIALGTAVHLLAGCAAVTVSPDGQPKMKSRPYFQQKQSFFLVGLLPNEQHIDVQTICRGRHVTQLQTVDTFSDRLIGLVTLGIYTPRTARVWCEGATL